MKLPSKSDVAPSFIYLYLLIIIIINLNKEEGWINNSFSQALFATPAINRSTEMHNHLIKCKW